MLNIQTHMDYEGQARAEKISRAIITVFGFVGLIFGAVIQQFSQTIYILAAGFALALIITIPPYPLYHSYVKSYLKAVILGRVIANGLRMKSLGVHNKQIVRHSSGWFYRTIKTDHPKSVLIAANVISGIMWWWVMWHLWHEPEHIIGEFDYPDPSKWTNAELGIPPDDFEEEISELD
ncbi:CLUMA_CG019091, isoform A [Clunio marinus]|uniref:CLUMA_CG019091, isoform A n=1 Tax=Clunio marinus TaxID=568069 RepID=A0A1J1J1G5_9DIPT|nr:CLUMA_CG019091, isoform A [Clunio marinus]